MAHVHNVQCDIVLLLVECEAFQFSLVQLPSMSGAKHDQAGCCYPSPSRASHQAVGLVNDCRSLMTAHLLHGSACEETNAHVYCWSMSVCVVDATFPWRDFRESQMWFSRS